MLILWYNIYDRKGLRTIKSVSQDTLFTKGVERMKQSQQIYTIDEISDIIVPILNKYKIEKAYVFGSYARGEATSESDIDLYIPLLPYKMGIRYFGMYEDIQNAIEKRIDVITDNTTFNSDEEKKCFFASMNKDKEAII